MVVVTCVFLLGELASLTNTPGPWQLASEPSSRQPPCQIGRFFVSTDLVVHHGGMMHGGGEGTESRMGAGGEVFCSIRFLASIKDGG